MNELIENYILYLRDVRKLSERTVISYRQDLKKYEQFCSDQESGITETTYEQARRFLAMLIRTDYSSNSVNRILSGVKGFFSFCIRYEYCEINPFSRIKGIGGGRRLPSVLSHEEVKKIIEAPGNDFAGIRDRVIFELLYSTGCRLSELTGMNLADVHLAEKTILVHGKGDKDRFVFLTPSAQEILLLYIPLRNARQQTRTVKPDDKVSLIVNNRGHRLTPQGVHYIFQLYTRKLGIPKKITPHTFRHTFATHILENDAGIRVVQELLGHENVSTTQIYSHVSAGRLKEVYKKSHPHG
ncbi:MAG: tyrosine-type recombinase/integrase [Spirochaetales bacterium]|nr:tyrosine-type recombinase/integrase [Spirochaetales bacterium]